MAEITTTTKTEVLSASRPAIAETQAEQKDQHKRAHPECGIGGHRFLWRRSGLRLPASANVLYQDCGEPGRSGRASGISLPPPDKFVGLAVAPCGGMPHTLPSPLRRMELRYRVGSSPLQASGARRSGEEVSIL